MLDKSPKIYKATTNIKKLSTCHQLALKLQKLLNKLNIKLLLPQEEFLAQVFSKSEDSSNS